MAGRGVASKRRIACSTLDGEEGSVSEGNPHRTWSAGVVVPTAFDAKPQNVGIKVLGSREIGDNDSEMMNSKRRHAGRGLRHDDALCTRDAKARAAVVSAAVAMVSVFACSSGPPVRVLAAEPSASVADSAEVPAVASASAIVSAIPAVSAEPKYDRDADLRERMAEARRELGAETPMIMAGGVFLLAGAPGWRGTSLAMSHDLVEGAMTALYNNRLKKKPAFVIPVYLFGDSASYEAYCRQRWDHKCLSGYGSYHPDERFSVMNAGLGLGTLTHEMVHPLIEADFPDAPTWIDEGIASLFEAPLLPRTGEIHGARNWRLPKLVKALRANRDAATLDRLFGMSNATFRNDDESLHYAMARYTCQWLDETGKLWPFYQRWRDSFASDPDGRKAFVSVVGRSPREVVDEWVRWVGVR